MANTALPVVLLTIGACCFKASLVFIAGIQHYNVVHVSKSNGSDDRGCGGIASPCKSLQIGFDKLAPGGLLFVDGEGTEVNPYTCQRSGGKLIVNKAFNMTSHRRLAYISCFGGIRIQFSENFTKIVTLSKVSLKNTSISFVNVATAVIRDCVFSEAKNKAISVKTKNSLPVLILNISNTLFKKNHGCLKIDFKNLKSGECNFKDVGFIKNYVSRGQLIEAWEKNRSCDRSFSISMDNVTVSENGPQTQYEDAMNGKKTFRLGGGPWTKHMKNATQAESSFLSTNVNKVQVQIANICSKDNTNMRFLNLLSYYSWVKIDNSSFDGHRVKTSGAVINIKSSKAGIRATVSVKNTTFNKSVAGKQGGVVFVDGGKRKAVCISFENTTIQYSFALKTGCAVEIGKMHRGYPSNPVSSLYVLLHRLIFTHANASCVNTEECKQNRVGNLCFASSDSGYVNITNSLFSYNRNTFESTMIIRHGNGGKNQGPIHVLITDTKFEMNTIFRNSSQKKYSILQIDRSISRHIDMAMSVVNISHSSFSENIGTIIKLGKIEKFHAENVTFNKNKGLCLHARNTVIKYSRPFNASVYIRKSLFENNDGTPLEIRHTRVIYSSVHVEKTIFRENNFGEKEAINIKIGEYNCFRNRSLNCSLVSGNVSLQEVEFTGNIVHRVSGSVFGIIVLPHPGNFSAVIRNTVFKDNFQDHVYNKPEVSYLIFLRMPISMRRYNHDRNSTRCTGFPKFIDQNNVTFENTIFTNNTGFSNIIYIDNGKTTFRRSLFENNFSHNPQTGTFIFIEQGTPSITFESSIFNQAQIRAFPNNKVALKNQPRSVNIMPFIYFAGLGPFIVSNTSFMMNASEVVTPIFIIQNARYVHFDERAIFACPVGSYMRFDNSSHIVPAQFTHNHCRLNITRLKFTCRRCPDSEYSLERGKLIGTQLNRTWIRCLKCPFGAECSLNIRSRRGFYGYVKTINSPAKLKFEHCPEQYCVEPNDSDPAVFNQCHGNRMGIMCGSCQNNYTESVFNNECRPKNDCNDHWFWVIAGVYSVVMALYLLNQPPIVSYLLKTFFWFNKRSNVVPNSRVEQQNERHGHCKHGYYKIVFYFYQVADLLMLESYAEILRKHYIVSMVLSFYNFHAQLLDESFGCPFPGMNVVTKQLFRSLQVFAVMAWIIIFYFLRYLLHLLTKQPRPPIAPYIAAIIEVLLLGYEEIGHTSLELLHCTPLKINGQIEWRLFLDGNITCWVHWWQFVLVAYNIIFVIPFLILLLVGTSKLRNIEIHPVVFVFACFIPLPFILYWGVQKAFKVKKENSHHASFQMKQQISSCLLEVLQGPFSTSDNQPKGAWYWESVLIGRRLVMLCLRSFIAKPIVRLMGMSVVCVINLVHDIVVCPYNGYAANIFSIISLFILFVIATINLSKASLISVGIHPQGFLKTLVDVLKAFEVTLLGIFPFLIGLLAAGCVVSLIVRFGVVIRNKMKARPSHRPKHYLGVCLNSDYETIEPLLNNYD